MSETQTPERREARREPLPKSFRPAWIYIGLMGLVVVVIGIASAIIALVLQ